MKLSELLKQLHIYLPLKSKEDVELTDEAHVFCRVGKEITLIFKTPSEFSGVSAIVVPIHTALFLEDSKTIGFYKIKEQTMMDQLEWYNKCKPELTKCVKDKTSIDTLSISLIQLKLICEHYKSYNITKEMRLEKNK